MTLTWVRSRRSRRNSPGSKPAEAEEGGACPKHPTTELSHNRKAAIDGQRRAGKDRGVVAGEPENRPSNLLRRRPAAEERCGLALGLERLDSFAGGLALGDMKVGQRRAGTDGVDANPVRHFFEGERAGHGED